MVALENEVIGDFAANHPPTLIDIWTTTKPDIMSRLADSMHLPISLNNSADLINMMSLAQLDERLPKAPSSTKHVFVVCSPHQQVRLSLRHWSFYSQGYLYHLTLPGKRSRLVSTSETDQQDARNSQLTVEDLRPTSISSQEVSQSGKLTALAAYEVGCTEYSPDELLMIARWIHSQSPRYNGLAENCQYFVLSMVERTVMTKRDCSVFVGTAPQIAAWDLADSHDRKNHRDDVEHGFLIQKPNTVHPVSAMKLAHKLRLDIPLINWQALRLNRTALAVKKLYQRGPHNPESTKPLASSREHAEI